MSFLYRHPAVFRLALTLYPPYLGTGIAVREVSRDFRRVVVTMKSRFYNRNAYGTHFGGSLYSMADPFYALMLHYLLGRDYVVWDRSACIDYLKPGRGTVTAVFDWTDDQLAAVRTGTADGSKYEPERTLDINDADGDTVARVYKRLYVRRRLNDDLRGQKSVENANSNA